MRALMIAIVGLARVLIGPCILRYGPLQWRSLKREEALSRFIRNLKPWGRMVEDADGNWRFSVSSCDLNPCPVNPDMMTNPGPVRVW